LRLLADGLHKWELRNRERRRDPRLLEIDHAVAGADHPTVADSVRQPHARAEIAAFEFSGRMREVEFLRAQIEDRPLVVHLSGRKIKRISRAQVQRKARSDLPVIANKELRDVRPRLDDIFLNVNREGVYLA